MGRGEGRGGDGEEGREGEGLGLDYRQSVSGSGCLTSVQTPETSVTKLLLSCARPVTGRHVEYIEPSKHIPP